MKNLFLLTIVFILISSCNKEIREPCKIFKSNHNLKTVQEIETFLKSQGLEKYKSNSYTTLFKDDKENRVVIIKNELSNSYEIALYFENQQMCMIFSEELKLIRNKQM